MCGIVGVVNLNGEPVDSSLLLRMRDSMIHRGPDDEGAYVDGSIGLGHRRLSIIDLTEAGRQPMVNEDGTLRLVYNGEVYNFQELRTELEQGGHQFRSRTDAEVVLHAYEEWGAEALDRLNGMFAFAIWDSLRRELFVARDRYGVKPLYYYDDGATFLVASEIKAFLEHPSFRVKVDPHALLEYFTFQNIFSDRTLFENVRLLPPGHYAVLSLRDDGSSLERTQFWDFHFRDPEQESSADEYRRELTRLFDQAVQRQLISDVPIGAYLSGGMDSGAITAVAAQHIPYLSTFTCGFDLSSASGLELGFDERERAEALSYRFRTEQYEVVLKAGDMERAMSDLIWHLEDLRVGQSYPNYYVSRLASKFVKVVLAGTGGDELFAGYPWRYYRAVRNLGFDDYVEKYYRYWQRLVPNRVIHRLFQPDVWNDVRDDMTIDTFRTVIARDRQDLASPGDYVHRSMYFEAKTFLHGLLLVEDKLSMAHGLEMRVPFLDNDVVDFASALPVSTKLRDLGEVARLDENLPGPKRERFLRKTNDGKLILRDVLAQYMPREYTTGVKQGFSGPDASWFRGKSIDYVRDLVLNPGARIYEYLREGTVKELVEEHLHGAKNRRLFIWSLLCFEWWLRRFG
jgi:asparagine synthase (glutamine-hydrolysing)